MQIPEVTDAQCKVYLQSEGATQLTCLSQKNNRAVYSVVVGETQYAVKFFAKPGDNPTYPYFAHRDILPKLKAHSLESHWRHIVIPDILKTDPNTSAGSVVWMNWVEGSPVKTLDGPFQFEDTVLLLQELKSISIDLFQSNNLRFYGQKEIQKDLRKSTDVLLQNEIFNDSDIVAIKKTIMPLFEIPNHRPFIVSNEDFRLANFICINDLQTGIIDWDGMRASQFEIEHCFAHMLLFVTEKPETYFDYCHRVSQSGLVDQAIFKACNILRSVIQLSMWRNKPDKKAFLLTNLKEMLTQ